MLRPGLRAIAAGFMLALAATAASAQDGHGPDAWRVTGVAANDVLNGRMGPGTNYPVIERFAPGERGLLQITCVPYMTFAHYERMTAAERNALPPRWCLMQSPDHVRTAWVNARFIEEDSGGAVAIQPAPAAPASDVNMGWTNEPDVDQAMILVREAFAASLSFDPAQSPQGAAAGRYFFAADLDDVRNAGADVIFNAQDVDGRLLRVYVDPDNPPMRGAIAIIAEFVNFGQVQQATFWVRRDSMQDGAPLRILQIEHANAIYP